MFLAIPSHSFWNARCSTQQWVWLRYCELQLWSMQRCGVLSQSGNSYRVNNVVYVYSFDVLE